MDFTLPTVAYADIFDYPLTHGELKEWMIFGVISSKKRKKYYFLPGRDNLVKTREGRRLWQPEKWEIAKRAANILSHIPTIQLAGVTGGLAMNNARRDDDIDFYLVVDDGTLWMSRLIATMLLDILHLRRRPNDVAVANKICLNMIVTQRGMGIPDEERDLFTAHEVLQMKPIFDRGNIYRRFLSANNWVQPYLPNAWRYRNKI